MSMPAGKQPEAGRFARAISAQIRASMEDQGVSGVRLSEASGLSTSYLSRRLRDEVSFTVNDIEAICAALGEDLGELLRLALRSIE